MTRHARKPVIIALFASLTLAAGGLAAAGQFRSARGPASLEDLERAIASGSADAATWNAYGDALRTHKRYAHAAAAYQRAIDMDPDRPLTRFNEALALAQSNAPEKFFPFFTQLTINDPKQAVDLLDRPELVSMHNDPRWLPAATSARAQAAD
jgi:tetratricopeptide (TPR) repeat protein